MAQPVLETSWDNEEVLFLEQHLSRSFVDRFVDSKECDVWFLVCLPAIISLVPRWPRVWKHLTNDEAMAIDHFLKFNRQLHKG